MTPEEVTTMKLSRTDLVKSCSAALLEELEQDRKDAERDVFNVRVAFDNTVLDCMSAAHSNLLDDCIEVCNGRRDRLEMKVCCELLPGEAIPAHALVIVTDGTGYDHNFRVQVSVKLTGGVYYSAQKVTAAQVHLAEVTAASTRKTDMDAKARLKLVAEALDSTPEGREALDALSRMRKALKK